MVVLASVPSSSTFLRGSSYLKREEKDIISLVLRTHRKNTHAAMEPNMVSTRKASDSPSAVEAEAPFPPCVDNLVFNNTI